MIIQPLEDYVLLEEIKQDATESGFILMEDTDIEKPNLAKVLALGPSVGISTANQATVIKQFIKENQTVLFKRHLFDEVTFNKKKYLLGKEEGIIAIVTDDSPEAEAKND